MSRITICFSSSLACVSLNTSNQDGHEKMIWMTPLVLGLFGVGYWMMNLSLVLLAQYQPTCHDHICFSLWRALRLPLTCFGWCKFWKFLLHKIVYRRVLGGAKSLSIVLSQIVRRVECNGEKILKIDQYLPLVWIKVRRYVFFMDHGVSVLINVKKIVRKTPQADRSSKSPLLCLIISIRVTGAVL